MRYNIKNSNISESLNAAMQKAMVFPIVTLVEYIKTMLMRWFGQRRAEAKRTKSRCTAEVEEILIEHLKDAIECAVIGSTEWIYQVNDGEGCVFTVDFKGKICTFRVFDVLLIPCCHALGVVGINNVDMFILVGECLDRRVWEDLWGENVLPPPNERDSDVPVSYTSVDTNAPKIRRGSGRLRTVRIPSAGEHPVSIVDVIYAPMPY